MLASTGANIKEKAYRRAKEKAICLFGKAYSRSLTIF